MKYEKYIKRKVKLKTKDLIRNGTDILEVL